MDYKITIYCALLFATLFGLASSIFYFGNWEHLALGAAFGFFIGILAAPEIKPKKFKYGWLLQILTGAIAGIICGIFFHLNGDLVVGSCIIGGFLGWLAPSWVKHVPIP